MPTPTHRLRRHFARLLPHNNPRCVAPPGAIEGGEGRPILVPSLMRSGTHVLIDLILNNLAAYRRTPLYIDLDQCLMRGVSAQQILAGGSYVLKTHYPSLSCPDQARSTLRQIAAEAIIIQPVRDPEEIFRSQSTWGMNARQEFEVSMAAFEEFWKPFKSLQIPFSAMTAERPCQEVLEQLCTSTGQPMPESPIYPPHRQSTAQVLFHKALTRLLGHRSPVINTTIAFALTR